MCGEYPQHAANRKMQKKLYKLYNNKKLDKTAKSYMFDSREDDCFNDGFISEAYDEYEYQGKKYIRVKATFYDRETF